MVSAARSLTSFLASSPGFGSTLEEPDYHGWMNSQTPEHRQGDVCYTEVDGGTDVQLEPEQKNIKSSPN